MDEARLAVGAALRASDRRARSLAVTAVTGALQASLAAARASATQDKTGVEAAAASAARAVLSLCAALPGAADAEATAGGGVDGVPPEVVLAEAIVREVATTVASLLAPAQREAGAAACEIKIAVQQNQFEDSVISVSGDAYERDLSFEDLGGSANSDSDSLERRHCCYCSQAHGCRWWLQRRRWCSCQQARHHRAC